MTKFQDTIFDTASGLMELYIQSDVNDGKDGKVTAKDLEQFKSNSGSGALLKSMAHAMGYTDDIVVLFDHKAQKGQPIAYGLSICEYAGLVSIGTVSLDNLKKASKELGYENLSISYSEATNGVATWTMFSFGFTKDDITDSVEVSARIPKNGPQPVAGLKPTSAKMAEYLDAWKLPTIPVMLVSRKFAELSDHTEYPVQSVRIVMSQPKDQRAQSYAFIEFKIDEDVFSTIMPQVNPSLIPIRFYADLMNSKGTFLKAKGMFLKTGKRVTTQTKAKVEYENLDWQLCIGEVQHRDSSAIAVKSEAPKPEFAEKELEAIPF